MKVTNKNGLPEVLVRAIENDPYSSKGSDYSCTTLLKPGLMVTLEREHEAEITEDASDRLYALYGQIVHHIIERSGMKSEITEERYACELDTPNGKRIISAQIDSLFLEDGTLSDWKFTTSFKFKSGTKPDKNWIAQLNIQRYILHKNGINVKKLQIVGLLRDHSMFQVYRDKNYPKTPVRTVTIPMWDLEKTEKFMVERVLEIEAKTPCTNEDRWATDETWAQMKKDRKKALKLYYTKEEAIAAIVKDPETFIEHREPEYKRCDKYCKAAPFCNLYRGKNEINK